MLNDKNLAAINIIRRAGRITRQELAQKMEISLSLVNKLSADLLSAGLIEREQKREREMGRPADLLSIRADAGLVVGCEITDNRQTMVVTDLRAEVIYRCRQESKMPMERDAILQSIRDMLEQTVAAADPVGRPVLGAGLAVYGIVDAVSGTVDGWGGGTSFMSSWIGHSLRDALAEVIPYPVVLADDVVRPLGVAESLFGRGSRELTFIYAIADTSIGMAFLQEGRPYVGFSHIAGEIAHIPVGSEERRCICGSSGCLCALVSLEAIRESLRRELAQSPVRSVLRDRCAEASVEEVVRAAADGDKPAITVLIEAGEYYGKAIATVLNLFGPPLVVLGGRLARSEPFLDAVRRTARMRALQRATRDVRIERSSLDELGAARGAAAMVLDALFESRERNILSLVGGRPGNARR